MSVVPYVAMGLGAGALVGGSAKVAMDPQARTSDRFVGGAVAGTFGTALTVLSVIAVTEMLKPTKPVSLGSSLAPVAALGVVLALGVPLATSAVLGWQYMKTPGQ